MVRKTMITLFLSTLFVLYGMSVSVHAGEMKHEYTGHSMAMHHQHMMLNHALKMALEGSNLVMLGQMGMAKGVDEVSIDHGKTMMKHARSLYNEIMSGEAMMKMHGEGKSPKDDPAMAYTHELAGAMLKVMDLLDKMPPTGAK